jgi:L-lactate dehydrogenase complex protein LldE
MNSAKPRVGLFVTCLVDLMRPSVGFAAVKLLQDAGCIVEAPQAQVCCGQPAYNSGDRATTAAIAAQVIETFKGYDYVVAPSGSCAGMISKHFPTLFPAGSPERAAAEDLSARTHELVAFLTRVMKVKSVAADVSAHVTYHDSCSGLRELKIKDEPRQLLNSIKGVKLTELADADVCCGFGGTFCVKYPDISIEMAAKKTENITASGADMLLAGDLGCLMNMAGKLAREASHIDVRHVAEVLAGDLTAPAIGKPA